MADEAAALFNQYENEYCNKSTDISRKISAISNLSGELRRRKISEVEGDIKDADQVVKEYKADLAALKEELKKAAGSSSAGDAARAELGLGGEYSNSAAQRDRMLVASERLNKTTERLTQGRQQLYEAEASGNALLEELNRQRAVMQNASRTLQQADADVTQANSIAKRMSGRAKWFFRP